MVSYVVCGFLLASAAISGTYLGEVVFRCPSCSAERQAACPKLTETCAEIVREPGCGCCPVCARQDGESCGVYTPRCSSGLRCYPKPDSELPLEQLVQGLGQCGRKVDVEPTGSQEHRELSVEVMDPSEVSLTESPPSKKPTKDGTWTGRAPDPKESAVRQHQQNMKSKMKYNKVDDSKTPRFILMLLEWVVNGLLHSEESSFNKQEQSHVFTNRIQVVNLNDLIVQQINHDFPGNLYEEKIEVSQEDKRLIKIMESSAELKDGHYQLPLPFMEDDLKIPNNRHLAEQRISSLKKFHRNESFLEEYKTFIEGIISSGHAELVPQEQLKMEAPRDKATERRRPLAEPPAGPLAGPLVGHSRHGGEGSRTTRTKGTHQSCPRTLPPPSHPGHTSYGPGRGPDPPWTIRFSPPPGWGRHQQPSPVVLRGVPEGRPPDPPKRKPWTRAQPL
ncbi:hypothetical protein SKAU_G00246780 [Synaphobranchus kaupii]|uniref:IGFBP N-terminal domain-containing protein n=1 Tax=Synaphobranchus kaupii TaxID=118154 RepID=A0A9Q1F217_SYNKA|nr:hypothetical protein SKAU_G00246780 [Synaphobranchus kaupii]